MNTSRLGARFSSALIGRTVSAALITILVIAVTSTLSACSAKGASAENPGASNEASKMEFTGDRAETERFIEWYKSIDLTAEQVATRKAALEALPAPCCSQFTADTCCCECNMKRATHGLAKYLIAKRGWSADAVRTAVAEWHKVSHPNGFRGDACMKGRCNLSFAQDGCAGMTDGVLVF